MVVAVIILADTFGTSRRPQQSSVLSIFFGCVHEIQVVQGIADEKRDAAPSSTMCSDIVATRLVVDECGRLRLGLGITRQGGVLRQFTLPMVIEGKSKYPRWAVKRLCLFSLGTSCGFFTHVTYTVSLVVTFDSSLDLSPRLLG